MKTGYHKLDDNDKLLPIKKIYRNVVGILLYQVTVTGPGISAAVYILNRSNEKPREKY